MDRALKLSTNISRLAQRALLALLMTLVAVVPLLFAPDPRAWRGVKSLTFAMLALALGGLALLSAETPRSVKRFLEALRAGPNLPVLLLVALGAVSCSYSAAPELSLVEWLRLVGGAAVYFVAATSLRAREQVRTLVDVLAGMAVVVSVLGLATYQQPGQADMAACFGNRQLLASFLLMLVPLLLALAFSDPEPERRVPLRLAAALALSCLVLARTRCSWVAVVAALLTLGAMAWRFRAAGRPGTRRSYHAALPLLVTLAALIAFLGMSGAMPAISARVGTLARVRDDADFAWRIQMGQASQKLIRARALFGWGIGTFPLEQSRTYLGSLPRSVLRREGPSLSEEAHNEYLQTAVELGIAGLGLHLWILGAFFAAGLRALRRRSYGFRRLVLMGCLAAVVGQAVDALANPAWRFADVSLLFWLMLGLGRAAASGDRPPAPVPRAAAAGRACGVRRLGGQCASVALTLVAMAGAWTHVDRHGSPVPTYNDGNDLRRLLPRAGTTGSLYGVTDASHTPYGGGILLAIHAGSGGATLVNTIRNAATGQDFGDVEDLVALDAHTLLAAAYPGTGRAGASELYRIDPQTAAATPLGLVQHGTTRYWIEGLALANGILYASAAPYDMRTGRSDSYGADCANHLLRIDVDLKRRGVHTTDLGKFGPCFLNVEAIAYSPEHGLVGADIGTLDPATGYHTFHTRPALLRIDPHAADRDNLASRLCDLPPGDRTVLVVNPNNKIASPSGPFLAGLDFAPNGTLYAATIPTHFGGESRLVTVDLTRGTLTDVGHIGGPELVGLQFIDGIAFPALPPPAVTTAALPGAAK